MNKEQKLHILRLILGAGLFAGGIFTEGIIELILFIMSYLILGFDVIFNAFKNIIKGKVFDENLLMSVATGGAFAIGEHPEAAAVMLFYQVGEFFQELAVTRSQKSIVDLMDIRPDYANMLINSEVVKVKPEDVKIGDTIIIKPGEKVPLDGVITSGSSTIDTAALTGESVPRTVETEDEVISGCVNISGVLTVKTIKLFGESTAAKILELTQNAAEKKAKTENFITSFARIYTPVVVLLAALLTIVPALITGEWGEWLRRSLVFLVISCPCALVISVPLGFFAGIGAAGRKGILVKGGNYLETLADLEIAAFDKTGTLTKGSFKVTEILPAENFTSEKLMKIAAHAEAFSTHPIAISVREAYKEIDRSMVKDYAETAGRGVSADFNHMKILAGNAEFLRESGVEFTEVNNSGTKLYVSTSGKYTGCIIISDEIKPDTKAAIAELKRLGVKNTVMLTGDNAHTAFIIAEEADIDDFKAGLLPHEKVAEIEELEKTKSRNGKLAFIGDGINDAPVLARADLGVAMGGIGSDAAIEAADVVLMTDSISKLAEAVKIARRTRLVVTQNIIFALSMKVIFLCLGALGFVTMREAIFADVGVSLLAVLNSMRLLKYNN